MDVCPPWFMRSQESQSLILTISECVYVCMCVCVCVCDRDRWRGREKAHLQVTEQEHPNGISDRQDHSPQ